jgi:hypothetical protein
MIILIIALFTICSLISFFFIKNSKLRWLCGCLSVLLLAGSVLLLVANFAWNWGTKEVITEKTQTIYTAGQTSAPYGVLVASEIGTKSDDYAFTYRSSKNGKVATHFVPDTANVINAVKIKTTYKTSSSLSAKITTKTTRRQFSSGFTKLLFGIGGGQNALVKKKVTVTVPKATWLVLTADQAKELSTKAPQIEAAAQAQIAQEKAKLQAALAAAPTPEAKLKIEQAAQAQAAAQQAIENDPVKNAEQQIAVIKTALGLK